MEILVSGASTGIGRAAVIHLARLGHTVWAGVRTEAAAEAIERLNVRGLYPILLDVTQGPSIEAAVHTIQKKSGMLHALVNNAGIVVGGPIEGLSIAKWREQFDVNFFGLIELTRACLPSLRESKGRIVNMSSISGRIASAFLGPYSASKFALEGFSDSLRREVRPLGIHVSVIEPGPIDTPIWRKSVANNRASASQFSDVVWDLYGPALGKFTKAMERAELQAAPVSVVLKAVQHALQASSPKARYPVGYGVGFMSRAAGLLPDNWMDQLLRLKL